MLRFLTAGESHGQALLVIIDGVPSGLPLTTADLSADLARRQLGYGRGRRMAIEQDRADILSGVTWTTRAVVSWMLTFDRAIAPGSPELSAIGYRTQGTFNGGPAYRGSWFNTLSSGDFAFNTALNVIDGYDGRTPEQPPGRRTSASPLAGTGTPQRPSCSRAFFAASVSGKRSTISR